MGHQRFYLELGPDQETPPADPWPAGFSLIREAAPAPALCRMLYRDVGDAYAWVDRSDWTDEQWATYVAQPGLTFWVLRAHGDPAGYFELMRDADGHSVEIAYFGLRPGYVGRGLGSRLLAAAVREARALRASRVWLHTCTKDHPHALANYQARGFRVFKVEDI
jgi:ribosomal protein S18 acetylase RimI-like enzyme